MRFIFPPGVVFIAILAINAFITLLYIIINITIKKDKKGSILMRGVIMLCTPIVGASFMLLSHILFKVFFRKPVSLADVVFSKERVETFSHAEEEWERDIVPIEEAISVTETGDLRRFMMSVVRGDIKQSLASIMLALNSEDTETSHYAAAVLQDELNGFRENVAKKSSLILEQDGYNFEEAIDLLEYMDLVLAQQILPETEQLYYVGIMDNICDIVHKTDANRMPSGILEAMGLRLLEIDDFDNCFKWCERAVFLYPNTLSSYTVRLKLFFKKGERERFFNTLDELKASSVVLDSETLGLIRVFQ